MNQKIFFIGAHLDDIELGAGATLYRINRYSGNQVVCVTLSSENPRHPELKNEHFRSMEILGIKEEQIILGDFPIRNFSSHRQSILEFLRDIHEKYRPSIIFTHSRKDIHQDHVITLAETLRAFRDATILGFEILRSSWGFHPNLVFEIDEISLNKKLDALSMYKSYQHRYYFNPSVIKSQASYHGNLFMKDLGEGFEVLRFVATPESLLSLISR